MVKFANENTLFYIALYWVACLPNGASHIQRLCDEYNMPYMDINAPQKTLKQAKKELFDYFNTAEYDARYPSVSYMITNGVTYNMAKQFLDDVIHIVSHSSAEKTPFKMLEKRRVTSGMEFNFSDEIEAALINSCLESDYLEIDRQIVGHGMICVHDDGQAFAVQSDEKGKLFVEKFEYPGYPNVPHQVYTRLTSEDIAHAPKVVREVFYRIIPLEEGQQYVWGYHTQTGDVVSYNQTAYANEIYAVDLDEADYDPLMSDEDILMHPTLGMSRYKSDMSVGAVNEFRGSCIQETDNPNIVKEVSRPMPCMDVTQRIQIGYGDKMKIVEPGDKLIAEYIDSSDVFILRKKILEKEGLKATFTFVDKQDTTVSVPVSKRPRGPKLH